MSLTNRSGQMILSVLDECADEAELELLALEIRKELLELDIDVEPVRNGAPPPGARSAEMILVGALLVSFGAPDVVKKAVEAVQSWLGMVTNRSVRIEMDGDVLELKGVSARDQRRLVDEWIRRHSGD